ncbi:hypothetical protein MNB_SV-13-950 [hydrothermal vent metagenome]|uniref:Uncharacterized protein n=1 Tax=hydrothermal vent metagenome TaxID=652676 RepID=A0A1W1D134_9ZZZZ
MKNLELKKIEQLLSIIPNHPAIRIMHISQSGTQLSDALASFVKEREYEFLLNITNDVFYEEIKDRYRDNSSSVKKMKFEQRRYVSMAKIYDYVFVTANVPNEMQEQFVKNIYGHIKNAGNIIIFLEKNNLELLDSWRQLLEKNYFVATNTIDLFENYEIVISKKMHGWGG